MDVNSTAKTTMAAVETVGDDVVEYWLFPFISTDLNGNEQARYLQEQLENYLAYLGEYLVDYIWQNEPLNLRAIAETGTTPGHLYGSTNFGENIEDEWFIVFLLQKLTSEFTGLIAKANDNDGEFLLIEAAENLPTWLSPENAENRVYIHNGRIHIIPRVRSQAAPEAPLFSGTPTLQQAISCVLEQPHVTEAPLAVQNDVHRRIADYPEKRHSSSHRAHCYIPASLAAVLDHSPALVAAITRAFFYRDPLDLKACVTFKHFRPGTRVMQEVRFTRCLYAQLIQQRFLPDRRSGWNMLPPSNPKHKAYDLGMKLAHGAEILCSKCADAGPSASVEEKSKRDPRWQRFLQSLGGNGYFGGELEGSRKYQRLLDDAREYFYTAVSTKDSSRSSAGQRVLQVLNSATYDIEEMRQMEKHLPPAEDDSWLELTAKDLDEMMQKVSGRAPKTDSFDTSSMSESMKTFVEKVSSHEGAEFPRDDSDIQLDPNSFMQNMQKMFDFQDSDHGSSSDLDEYGSDDELKEYSPRYKLNAGGAPTAQHPTGDSGVGDYLGLQDLMHAMDKELDDTTIGKSFEKHAPKQTNKNKDAGPPKPPPRRKKKTGSHTPSPQKTPTSTNGVSHGGAPKAGGEDEDLYDVDDIEDDFSPVDVDVNVVKNLMESYSAQGGQAGPATNILTGMGVRMPKDFPAARDHEYT